MPDRPPDTAYPADPALDEPFAPPAGDNAPVMGVAELSRRIKGTIEDAFGYVRVRGEISRPSFPGSGHCYLRLKDDQAVIDGVVWRSALARMKLRPEEGLEVIATGRLTTFPGKSTYQIVIDRLELAGQGALLKLLDERRRALEAEGLFAPERKRPLPFLPEVIGVVTSPAGAVIRDILHRLADRFPRQVLIWPVVVQGETAAAQVAAAIRGFNRLPTTGWPRRPDVLIVARGGGSLEDLWAFNEEVVVRAAAESTIPLISAVGHETDTTLIDFASDRRAPTPTAAAEMAVPVRADLVARVAEDRARLTASMQRAMLNRRRELVGLVRGLPEPRRLLEAAWQRFDDRTDALRKDMASALQRRRHALSLAAGRLKTPKQRLAEQRGGLRLASQRLASAERTRMAAVGARLERIAGRLTFAPIGRDLVRHRRALAQLDGRLRSCAQAALRRAVERLDGCGARLESLSYRGVLHRGYAVVRDADGAPVTSAAATATGQALWIEFREGREAAVPVLVAGALAARRAQPARRTAPTGSKPRQKDLFER
ncbi:MAG: exodeoxyribonuclease VII large subunit [Alphaproteobacteria bacterium]